MLKKLISIIVLLGLFLLGIQSAYALETYVGVRILNLTDDPSASCAGQAGYGEHGRIRAISSILPDFPIYFELRHALNESIVWSGNSVEDTDYTIGEVMWMPSTVDLSIGGNYTLFFDVDAIRIYLPLVNYGSFVATPDNNYWTAGRVGVGGSANSEYMQSSGSNNCAQGSTSSSWSSGLFFVSNDRDPAKLNHPCMTDSTTLNCHTQGIMGISNSGTSNFRTYGRYNNLLNSNVGNFYLSFTFS